MKKYKLRAILMVISIFLIFSGFAQTNQAQIKGFIYSLENEPSQFSTVVLMNQDSVFMKGTLSLNDGSFILEKIDPGPYFILVRNIEFNPHVSSAVLIENDETVTLDTIYLETRVFGLQEIVVKGEKSIVEMHPDKMVYNVSSSVNASGNNGLELLSKTPGVMVDLDNNISLQGKSGVRIFINGRPSRLSGSDLSNLLEGMRSDNIESIDLITNPSAKYEAEGSGGIIDIKMKKSGLSGFNGNIIGNYSRGIHPGSGLGTTLNVNTEKINIYSNINYSDQFSIDNFIQTTEREKFIMDMETDNLIHRQGLNISGGLDYRINSESTFGIDAKALLNERNGDLESITNIKSIDGNIPAEILNARVLSGAYSDNYNMNMYYNYSPNGSSNFSADFSLGKYSNENNTEQPNTYYSGDGLQILRTADSRYDTNTDIDLLSGKVDYEKRVNKLTFSTGAKYSYIKTYNKLAHYEIQNNQPILDDNRSNRFSYLEKVAAAYFIFGAKLSERISLNSGLRVENTSSLGELESAIQTADDVVARDYTSWFPNISLSYDDQKNHGISLNFGKRITRPYYQDLNPFETKTSEISSWKGNPFLKPNYITNYQLTYTFKRKLIISNNYSITRDFFATIFEAVGDKSTILVPRNMQNVYSNGLSASYSQRAFNWWNFNAYFIYNYTKYDGNLNGTVIDIESNTYNFRLQNNINLPEDIKMELSYSYSSPWIWRGSIYVESYQRLDLGLKREFYQKLLIQITASDLLKTGSDFYYNSNYGGLITNGIRSFDWSRFGITATYKFGNQKMKGRARKNSAIDEELKRISE
jgi:outer membrane receptor protein involved in Fe transport